MECLRRIAAADLNEVERFLLANWVNTYLQLQGRHAVEYERLRQRADNQEVMAMEMTWAERMQAEADARAEAKVEAKVRAQVEARVRELMEQGLKQGMEQGKEQGLKQGKEQGLKQGKKESLESLRRIVLRQMEQRFGPLPERSRRRIQGMSLQSLADLAEKIVVVRSLEEMGLEASS